MKNKHEELQLQKSIIDYLGYLKDVYVIRNNSFAGKIISPSLFYGVLKAKNEGRPLESAFTAQLELDFGGKA